MLGKVLNTLPLIMLCLAIGCSNEPPALPTPPGPLSVEEWKTLPVQEKYDEASFERIRQYDPKLRDERAWDRFMREVVVPERKQDIPGVPGQKPVDPQHLGQQSTAGW